jgi:hypothetical protein
MRRALVDISGNGKTSRYFENKRQKSSLEEESS